MARELAPDPTEAQLREREERYRLLAEMIPQLVWTADATGEFTYLGRRAEEYTGKTLDELLGHGLLALIHDDDRETALHAWRHAVETGERFSAEFRVRRYDGTHRWFLARAMPLRDDAGHVERWFGTLTDIEEQKAGQAQREDLFAREREARQELERIAASRTRLIRGLSHDLKNPLGAADGFAALLEEGDGRLDARQLESVHRIRRSIRASLDLVEDLVEFARAEAGQLKLDRVPVDVTELARIVAEDFQARVAEVGLGEDIHLDQPLPTKSDPERIKQIISNLMSNATKYAKQGTITVTAELRHDDPRAPKPGDWIAVDVRDTGPGIPADKQDIIFQEFTRLDPDAPHGAGVGLAISRQIARALGGDITVDSTEGQGATFTLWLPPEGSPQQEQPAARNEPTPKSPQPG